MSKNTSAKKYNTPKYPRVMVSVNLDGTEPKPGDALPHCKCFGTNVPTRWCARPRT